LASIIGGWILTTNVKVRLWGKTAVVDRNLHSMVAGVDVSLLILLAFFFTLLGSLLVFVWVTASGNNCVWICFELATIYCRYLVNFGLTIHPSSGIESSLNWFRNSCLFVSSYFSGRFATSGDWAWKLCGHRLSLGCPL
jgi:hypothetical protein